MTPTAKRALVLTPSLLTLSIITSQCGGASSTPDAGTPIADGGGSSGESGSSSGDSGSPVDAGHPAPVNECLLEAGACDAGVCCAEQCCSAGQVCCLISGPVDTIECYTGTFCPSASCTGSMCPVSDRNKKRDIVSVDPQAVLDKVVQLPISTWSYKFEDPSIRHMGPMAQDFRAAFGLGDSDRSYYTVDAHGVEMAAIQALAARVDEQTARIERLEQENAELRRATGKGTKDPR